MNTYKVIGRDSKGKTFYYKGRAGAAFISVGEGEAFGYDSLNGARRRATNLNQMTAIHGVRFFVPVGEELSIDELHNQLFVSGARFERMTLEGAAWVLAGVRA